MSEELDALYDGRLVGRLTYRNDRMTFRYADEWRRDSAAFPLSLSMPIHQEEHLDEVARPFVSGLLPDDSEVLRRWGQRFQVSPRNPFRLLQHVGEECAGGVQFVHPDATEKWLSGQAPSGIDWLDRSQFEERIRVLVEDRSRSRRMGDEGHFSLAGAQPKTALYWDENAKRWGVPWGATPTTHILKPNLSGFDAYDLNEVFCLRLVRRLGLMSAQAWTESIAGFSVIVVKRYDRHRLGDRVQRIHQEDMCQALARMPDRKYENEGGPSAKEIFDLIRNHSTQPQQDLLRFLDGLIFNYLIGGTDAHAKNFGFLLAEGGQVRLAPLYDLSSSLPYPEDIPPRKARLAMKIGGQYFLYRIGARNWEKAAAEWKLDPDEVFGRIIDQARSIRENAPLIAEETLADGAENRGDTIRRLIEAIQKSADSAIRIFSSRD